MPSCSLSTLVLDSSDEKLDVDNRDEHFQPRESIAKKCVNSGKELVLYKDEFQNNQLVSVSNRLKFSATDLIYFFSTLVKVLSLLRPCSLQFQLFLC